ncbi:MAG: bifunctional NADP-dependent methylenetetrahydromethanopterin dehydrogenase/methylenetetrahydrofolate dehydrogenase [Planctomycetaceae bacterium]|nr:bifunctional NADP-dependent methylenetetrahydromethanopterin dehydrogenase/methylenetetrahydrofolate dehydrogenase [Planctomycetaceae bacterium]
MKTILIQLDTDSLPSTFDRVVAVDAGVDELFSYGGVNAGNVETLVHGAMFTRGVPDLKSTAIFLGGSQVADGEALLKRVKKIFFGPMRVSVMMDSNGSNTTAAAAVLAARKHVTLKGADALVLAGTGPVGQRASQLLAKEGARVRVASRSVDRARQTCDAIVAAVPGAELTPVQSTSSAELEKACEGVAVVIAAGAAGVELLSAEQVKGMSALKVAIDLNAVPPAGIAGVEVMDKAVERNGVLCYGAIGVGGTKMKIHKAALKKLFTANDLVLDTEAIYAIGSELG